MWFDRITCSELAQLPPKIESSRYVAMEAVSVNGHSRIDSGALLVDDGSGEFRGEQATSIFSRTEQMDDTFVEHDIINTAISTTNNFFIILIIKPVSNFSFLC